MHTKAITPAARALFVLRRAVNEAQWDSSNADAFDDALLAALGGKAYVARGAWPLDWKQLGHLFGGKRRAAETILRCEALLPRSLLVAKKNLARRAFRVRYPGSKGVMIYPGDSAGRARELAVRYPATSWPFVIPEGLRVTRVPRYDSYVELTGANNGVPEWTLDRWNR